MTATSWLRDARVEGGRLVIPGRPVGHAADVLLTRYGIEIQAGTALAELDWDEYGMTLDRFMPRNDGWVVGEWIAYRNEIGIGINTHGVCGELTEAVRQATSTLRNLAFSCCFVLGGPFYAVPLWAGGGWSDATPCRERDTFRALCMVLAEREEIRPRLEDPEVLRRLARDLVVWRRRAVPESLGMRRKTLEIVTAMRHLGYEHKILGRPVAGDELPSLEEATDRVAESLARNPYTWSIPFRRPYVEAVVNERYLLVKPWPFAALTG